MRGVDRSSPRAAAALGGAVALAFLASVALPSEGAGQDVRERTPNLHGGWVGEPGALHFNVVHRFWVTADNLINSPTMLLGVPLPGNLLAGVHYGSNSNVAPGSFNEWELFGRWAFLAAEQVGVDAAVTGAWNTAAGSADGELSVAAPMGPVRLLGAGRVFSDARGRGDAGGGVSGGATLRLRDGVALAGDVGAVWVGDEDAEAVWGAGLQLRIPTTPHTLSIQAANTRTGTLQGSVSHQNRTTWGFEFTVPITFARYFGRPGDREPDDPEPAAPVGDTVVVTMTDDLLFEPDTLEIEAGTTVLWRNTTPLIHTVTADPEAERGAEEVVLPGGAEPFDSGDMLEGEEFAHTFTEPGEYVYICVPHLPVMMGTVRVVP